MLFDTIIRSSFGYPPPILTLLPPAWRGGSSYGAAQLQISMQRLPSADHKTPGPPQDRRKRFEELEHLNGGLPPVQMVARERRRNANKLFLSSPAGQECWRTVSPPIYMTSNPDRD
jgi:hypothetical protein